MELLPQIDERVQANINELIIDWTNFVQNPGSHIHSSNTEYERLTMNTIGLLNMVSGQTALREAFLDRISQVQQQYITSAAAEKLLGIVKGLKDSYEKGFLADLQSFVVADISADYMGQAEAMLNDDTLGKYGPVGCAVLTGAVLEDRLRRWCENQTPPLKTTTGDGRNTTLGPLIEEIRREKKLEKQVLRQLQWWADIRNHAAHGEDDKFSRQDVKIMLRGIDNFFVSILTSG